MKFLTFDNFLNKNIHINKFKNLKKFDNNLYKIIKNSCIINLTYTSICLYKLYKIFYILHSIGLYVTLIYDSILYDNKFINMLLKLSNNNFFNSKYWINGIITNNIIEHNIILLGLWLNKCYLNEESILNIPAFIVKLKKKIKYICFNLKFKNFSKFIFLLNVDREKYSLKECFICGKFLIGLCSLNYDVKLIDFPIYINNFNEVSLGFIIKFIVAASINGSFDKVILSNNKEED